MLPSVLYFIQLSPCHKLIECLCVLLYTTNLLKITVLINSCTKHVYNSRKETVPRVFTSCCPIFNLSLSSPLSTHLQLFSAYKSSSIESNRHQFHHLLRNFIVVKYSSNMSQSINKLIRVEISLKF